MSLQAHIVFFPPHFPMFLTWQISQSTKALKWIMDTLKAQGYKSKEEPPSMCKWSGFRLRPPLKQLQDLVGSVRTGSLLTTAPSVCPQPRALRVKQMRMKLMENRRRDSTTSTPVVTSTRAPIRSASLFLRKKCLGRCLMIYIS